MAPLLAFNACDDLLVVRSVFAGVIRTPVPGNINLREGRVTGTDRAVFTSILSVRSKTRPRHLATHECDG